MTSASNRDKLVCVTGASGFVGTHVVKELLQRGYKVRATVRDKDDAEKVAHLKEIAGQIEGAQLELCNADMMVEGCFTEPFAGCDYICHVAASVRLTAANPQKDIVDPAVKGTTNALEAAVEAGTVKRFVLTSSIAAIFNLEPRPGHVYSEKDWCQDANLKDSPYPLAKTLSERAAWDFMETQKPGFDLIAIQPAYVLGPVYTKAHLRSSPTLMRELFTGTFPLCPRFNFGVVDVRDVAIGHANALEIPEASGRYMLNHESRSLQKMALALRDAFPDNKKIPTRNMPNFLMYIAALFDKRLNFAFLRRNLDISNAFDNSRSKRELKMEYRPVEVSVVDTCKFMVERGLLKK